MASAQSIQLPSWGSVAVTDQTDQPDAYKLYSFTAAATGRLQADLLAGGSGIDPYLEIFDNLGKPLARNDNAARTTLDSRANVVLQTGKSYYVRALGNHDTTGSYTLSLTSRPVDDVSNTIDGAQTWRLRANGRGLANGRINYGDDTDVFSFVATRTGSMRADMWGLGAASTLTASLSITDASGAPLAEVEGLGAAAHSDAIRFNVVAGQTYYLRAASSAGSVGNYRLNVSTFDETPTELALPICGGVSAEGSLMAGEANVFSFTTSAYGYVELHATGSNGLDPFLEIYDRWGQPIATNDNISRTATDSRIRLRMSPGTQYYARVRGANGESGQYTLSVQSQPIDDVGNSSQSAAQWRLKRGGSGLLRGTINYSSDADVFAVTPSITGSMQIDMLALGQATTLNAELTVLDAQGRILATNNNGGTGADASVTFDVTAGQVVYIKALGHDGTTGRYALIAASVARPEPAPEPEPQPEPEPSDGSVTPGSSVLAKLVQNGELTQLWVLGTDGADRITLSQSGSTVTVVSDAGTVSFAGGFSSVMVYGFAGEDVLRADATVSLSVTLVGGEGNDQLFASGAGVDTLLGGEGDDLLVVVGGGRDSVSGGAGIDSFWLDSQDAAGDVSVQETAAKSLHTIAAFRQPYTTSTTSVNYIPLEIAGQNLADPMPTSYSTGWQSFSGNPLFGPDGPRFDDIRQGYLGDCYLLASIAGLAQTDPTVIRQMIAPMGDGTYAVRFFRDGREVYLRLDADLPVHNDQLSYAGLGNANALWVPLVEKAYAFFRYGTNTYSSIEGGWMATVNTEITNLSSPWRWINGNASDVSYIRTTLAAGHAITAASNSLTSSPVAGNHAYMVKAVEETASGVFVTVYNPWHVDGYTYDNHPEDGLLRLSFETFSTQFCALVTSMA